MMTGQHLKVLRIGVVGCHFAHAEWSMTIIPGMDCICHEETCDVVQMTLDALAHALDQHHGLNLVDLAGEWFWDGNPGAMQALSTYFPSAKGHL